MILVGSWAEALFFLVAIYAPGIQLAQCLSSPPPVETRDSPVAIPPPLVVPPIPTKPKPAVALSRRDAIASGATRILATAATAAASIVGDPSPSRAAESGVLLSASSSPLIIEGPPERQALLRALASKASDEEVKRLIAELEPLDPSKSNSATSPELDGTWELIYSVGAEAFSPLLQLPSPIRPSSLQLIGADSAREVGEGRVAQVLNFPIVPLSFLLSSGLVPAASGGGNVLEIQPPFRFEAVWDDATLRRPGRLSRGVAKGGARWKLVDSGSDADFRALNARDEDAQAAGRNMYKQRYLDITGDPGDLRVSEIISGDPVIVGAVFIHRRL